MNRRDLLDHLECGLVGKSYEPPVSWEGLAKSFPASMHHGSSIYFKRNVLVSTFKPHKLLSAETFGALVLDFLIFGNGYLERPRSMTGRALELQHALAKYVRRGADLRTYHFVRRWGDDHQFAAGSVFHMREADINQEVSGLPEYLSSLQAA